MKLPESADSLRAASSLTICYTDAQIDEFLTHCSAVGWCEALLALPPSDACWALAGLLPSEQREVWADACARRAHEYAATADAAAAARAARAAARAADYAASAAADAARAAGDTRFAARAADYAADAATAAATAAGDATAAAYRAEYRTAIRHGAELLLLASAKRGGGA